MNLYQEMLIKLLEKETVTVKFPQLKDPGKKLELTAMAALEAIKMVLEDDRFEDPECFMRIEKIMEIFDELGSGIEYRHDF